MNYILTLSFNYLGKNILIVNNPKRKINEYKIENLFLTLL